MNNSLPIFYIFIHLLGPYLSETILIITAKFCFIFLALFCTYTYAVTYALSIRLDMNIIQIMFYTTDFSSSFIHFKTFYFYFNDIQAASQPYKAIAAY